MISFQFKGRRRSQLFMKYPHGGTPPTGQWECHCGQTNAFNGSSEVYCSKCGTKLRIEENRDERQPLITLVRVGYVDNNGTANPGAPSAQTA